MPLDVPAFIFQWQISAGSPTGMFLYQICKSSQEGTKLDIFYTDHCIELRNIEILKCRICFNLCIIRRYFSSAKMQKSSFAQMENSNKKKQHNTIMNTLANKKPKLEHTF